MVLNPALNWSRHARQLLDDIRAAEAELDAGQGIPHDELKCQVEVEGELIRKELGKSVCFALMGKTR